MKEIIEIKRRTPGERQAYIEGFDAGQREQRFSKPPVIILRVTCLLKSDDFFKVKNDILQQVDSGVIVLPNYVEYVGMAPNDAEYEVILKAVKDTK